MLVLCAGVSGCVSSPRGNVTPVSAADIFRKLGCELRAEAGRNSAIVSEGWAITAELQLTSATSAGIGGSGTGKDSVSNGSFAFAFPLDYTRNVDRIYNQKVGINVRRVPASDCGAEAEKWVGGSLGISELFAEYRTMEQLRVGSVPPWIENAPDTSAGFTGSTTFKVTRGVKAFGPTWTLTHLTASLGLTASSADTNKLSISVSIPKAKKTGQRAPIRRPQGDDKSSIELMEVIPGPDAAIDPQLKRESFRNLEIFTLKNADNPSE